ncbi:MAG: hypothetical protein V1851_03140 [Patescibacteria group bacterium]
MAEAVQVEAPPPVSAKVAGEVVRGVNTGEAGILLTKKGELSASAVDVVAGEKVPPGTRDALFLQLFGETDGTKVDKTLQPLATQLDTLLTNLQKNVETSTASASEINAAIEQVVLQTDGWAEAYKGMNAAQRAQFLKGIRESSVIPLARKEFIDRAVGVEGNKYAAETTKYKEMNGDLSAKKKEQTTINTKITGKDRAKTTSERDAKKREVEDIQGEKQTLQERKTHLEELQAKRTADYITAKKTGADLTAALGADPNYPKWQDEIDDINTQLTGKGAKSIEGRLRKSEGELKDLEETMEAFSRKDQLTTEIDNLNKQVREAQASMLSARSELVKQLNELIKSLNGTMPEAAKQALNRYKDRLEQANIEVAKDKAKEAAKEGDILKGAEANLALYFTDAKYVKTTQRTSSRLRDFFRKTGQKEIKTTDLRTDFDGLFSNDGRGAANLTLTEINNAIAAGSGAGLSPEQVTYLNTHPDAKAKLVEQAKQSVFKAVSRQAVLHLNLSETDMRTLVSSPDFTTAAEQAVGDVQKLKDLKEKMAGAGLKGGTWKEIGAKLAKPALFGLILMVLIFLGIKGFGGA